MSEVVKIDGKKLKKRDYSYESYTNEGKKLHSDRYSGAKKEKTLEKKPDIVTPEKKVELQKKNNPYLKPRGIKNTDPKNLDLDLTSDSKNDPIVKLLTVIAIILGIMVGIAVLLTKIID